MKRLFYLAVCLCIVACWFQGCGGSKSGSGGNDLVSLNGLVVYRDKKDTLQSAFANLSFNGMMIQNTIVQDGQFVFNGLAASCCYKVVIQESKNGTFLGSDSLIELSGGENKRIVYVDRFEDSTIIVTPDSVARKRVIVEPKHEQ